MRSRWSVGSFAAIALVLSSCGGAGGDGGTSTPIPTPSPLSITSGTTATVAENSTGTVYQVTTAGGTGNIQSLTLTGPDAAAFSISTGGAVTFIASPDYEQPTDSDKNNIYLVTINITDGSGTASVNLAVTVTNVADFTAAVQVGGNYTRADHIAAVPGQTKLFVAQRNGSIYLVDPSTSAQGTLYLNIADVNDTMGDSFSTSSPGSRRGLLAVAAAPDYATSGTIYAYVDTTTALEVRKYGRTSGGLGDAASADVILRIPFPNTTRDVGGWLGFGADNLLYLTVGNASTTQPNTSLLGKVLRIDPSKDDYPADTLRDYAIPGGNPFATGGGAPEVYASGFVDPYRAGFDGTALYVGDQNNQYASDSHVYVVSPGDAGKTFGTGNGQTPPVLTVTPRLSGAAPTLVGGSVYRGSSADLAGKYVFFASGGEGSNTYDSIETVAASRLVQGTTLSPRSCCTALISISIKPVAFGEDGSRNLYFTDGSGIYVFRYQ